MCSFKRWMFVYKIRDVVLCYICTANHRRYLMASSPLRQQRVWIYLDAVLIRTAVVAAVAAAVAAPRSHLGGSDSCSGRCRDRARDAEARAISTRSETLSQNGVQGDGGSGESKATTGSGVGSARRRLGATMMASQGWRRHPPICPSSTYICIRPPVAPGPVGPVGPEAPWWFRTRTQGERIKEQKLGPLGFQDPNEN